MKKRLFSMLTVFCMILTLLPLAVRAAEEPKPDAAPEPQNAALLAYKEGDVNGDGKVNVSDVKALRQAVDGEITLTDEQRAAGDMDGDGQITQTDVSKLLIYVSTLPNETNANNAYAILYDDGTLVFQKSDTPESGKNVAKTYAVDLTAVYGYPDYAPWYGEREAVRTVSFKDKISPVSTVCWFYECSNLERVDDIRNLDTDKVTDINTMFSGCSRLKTLDVSGFNTSKVTDTHSMFYGCKALTALDVSGFDTANVTSMWGMFCDCQKLTTLDVSAWNTAKVTNMGWLFNGCTALRTLNVSGWDTSKVTNMGAMFFNCPKLTALNVSGFKTSNVADMSFMFGGCEGLTALDVSRFDTAKVTAMNSIFQGCKGLKALNVSGWNTASVTNMQYMFIGCENLGALDVAHFNTAHVADMSHMFQDCRGLTALDVSHFNTANVTSMSHMFLHCGSLTALDVSGFDTAKVTDMGAMFTDCMGLTALDVSRFNTANVTTMRLMFCDCYNLTMLDMSTWDTSKVTDMNQTFYYCQNLKTIYASEKFTTASVIENDDMFSGCPVLTGGNGTKLDKSHVDKTYARLDTASAPGYFTAKSAAPRITHVITSNAGAGGSVAPSGDIRVPDETDKTFLFLPDAGYQVRTVQLDGVDIGPRPEYTFQNVIKDHILVVLFEKAPALSAVRDGNALKVTLSGYDGATVAVSYFDGAGKFVSADLKPGGATVTFPLAAAHTARVMLLDADYRPLCAPVSAPLS